VNGLDVVFARYGYQKVIPFFLRQADRIMAISESTKQQCKRRGVPAARLRVIPIGIDVEGRLPCAAAARAALASRHGLPASGAKMLLTVGRLVERKGHAWFVANVLKRLPGEYIYVIAGSGPQAESIRNTSASQGLGGKVYLLGAVSEAEKSCLYEMADLFVMPNIDVQGDQEGFGIVVLEAASHGLPAIAADLEGIRDAVIDGRTGRLVAPRDASAFEAAILQPDIDRTALPGIVASHFSWKKVAQRYHVEFEDMLIGASSRSGVS
jgi:glycosyltransferase involved in cell wall biosynthesis